MDEKMLENGVKNEMENMFGWLKKHKNPEEVPELARQGHCNNFSSHCCLGCDKCWGGKKRSY